MKALTLTLFVFLAASFNVKAIENYQSFFDTSVTLAKFEAQELRIKRLWRYNVDYLKEYENPNFGEKDAKIVNLDLFFSLNKIKRTQILGKYPVLTSLGKEWERFSKRKKGKIVSLRKTVESSRGHYLQKIKEQIRTSQSNKVEIPFNAIDILVGMKYDEVESSIRDGSNSGVDAHVGAEKIQSQSPYQLIRHLFENVELSKNDVFYDMGSGYGRLLIYGAILRPDVKFRGIEIVKERAKETVRMASLMKLPNVAVQDKDVLLSDYSDGTVFYFFNPFPSVMNQVMSKLKSISKDHKIRIVALGVSYGTLRNTDWVDLKKELDSEWGFGIFESRSEDATK